MQDKITIQGLFKEVLKFKKEFITANLIALLAVFISTPIPLLMPLLVDEVLLQKPGKLILFIGFFTKELEPIGYILITLFIAVVLRSIYYVLNYFQIKFFTTISKNITFQIRKKALEHLKSVSMKGFELFGSSSANSLLVIDVETIDTFLSTTISKVIISILTLIGVGVVLLFIHWQLALFILFFNPFVVALTTKIAKKVAKLKKEQNRSFEIFQTSLGETLDLFAQIRVSNHEKNFINEAIDKAKKVKDDSIAFGYKSEAANRFSFLAFLIGFEIFRAASIIAVAYSNLTIGLMMAIFSYLWVMMSPVQELLNIQYALHSANVAIERVNKIFLLPIEPKYPHLKNPFSSKTSVKIENLTFAYEDEINVLNSVSLEIKGGKKVALVGASGSGKSTLAQILVGLYPITKGELFFNEVNVKEIGLDIVRDNVFLVLQNPQLFNASIKFNITLGKNVDNDELNKALKIAQIYEHVLLLPDGVDTLVGKNGVKLSGGQKQRLSLARMIIQNPSVVILDESTSALDIKTEALLFDELEKYLANRTTLIIAHRLSTIKNADYIYLLDRGKIIEEGSMEELNKEDSKLNYFLQKQKE
ncbi:MAG: ABC transporter ATP-binding protein/permease [Sulfurospirillaceae bacterium]|nr:ABC transporter ATP-binding protein/permease [Sulfurospirillaceae bacterium]MCK9546508.1 ABC transporter ATP-binding protein/permease [Sulfurospirillaceae bacterium]